MMARLRLMERQLTAFRRQPLSVRSAMRIIVSATLLSVVLGGVLIRLVDSAEFPSIGIGLWWALQTVTTVGYGDVVPRDPVGRLVGAVIMLQSIAFVSIVTAAITSSFVERARRERRAAAESSGSRVADLDQLSAQLTDITTRLDRIERALERP